MDPTPPNNEPFSKTGSCCNCKANSKAVLHVHIRHNGARGYVWVCAKCGQQNPFRGPFFVPNDKVESALTKEQVERLPVIMSELYARCAVCGSRDAEEHHWAPKGLFGDEAEQWPKDFLCKVHHDIWHSIVTPELKEGGNA